MKILIILLGCYFANGYVIDSGPLVKPSVGKVVPQPKNVIVEKQFYNINLHDFEFVVVGYTCDILVNALERYRIIMKKSIKSLIRYKGDENRMNPHIIKNIFVNLTRKCEYMPYFEMNEKYSITTSTSKITSKSIWGILRALETFSQLLLPDSQKKLWIPNVSIDDEPRFSHRGLLLDTSKHYISVESILTILDGMSYNKLNVFHWNIVSGYSFPYQSIKYPELSEERAYSPLMIYTQNNIKKIIEYARMRGIRVVAEFDIFEQAMYGIYLDPEILKKFKSYLNNMNQYQYLATENPLINYLYNFFIEIFEVFPDNFIHFGGHRNTSIKYWNTSQEVKQYFTSKKIKTYHNLEINVLLFVKEFMQNISFTPIIWNEMMLTNLVIPTNTVIQVLINKKLLANTLQAGHRVLLSGCWKLNDFHKKKSFCKYMNRNRNNIIGGEAVLFSEFVNDNNVLQRIFPAVSYTAELLWTTYGKHKTYDIKKRIEEHSCRLILRGIPSEPLFGPGFC